MTEMLFREDAYARGARGTVMQITDVGGIVLDRSLFYPTSGGQPGDSGVLRWDGGEMEIATTVKSNRFQPLRKNDGPRAKSLAAISIVKIVRQMRSIARISPPAASISVFEVSMPNVIAFTTTTAMMAF